MGPRFLFLADPKFCPPLDPGKGEMARLAIWMPLGDGGEEFLGWYAICGEGVKLFLIEDGLIGLFKVCLLNVARGKA
jgi:hypothetical protein